MENQAVQSSASETTLTPVQVPEPKAKFPVIYLVLSFFILVFLASTALLYYQNMQLKNMLAGYQAQPTVSPTPTIYQSPVPTTDSTSDWKTYIDSLYKYSIKYPSNMILEQITNDPFYSSYVNFKNVNDFFNVRAREGGVQDETDQIRAQTEGHVVTELIRNETLQIGGVTARLLEYTAEDKNENRSTLIIPSGKNVIIINTQSDIFYQILSTFKFTK